MTQDCYGYKNNCDCDICPEFEICIAEIIEESK